ncbi:MAG TPA: TetR/AcrR family transcriptional regulator [Thermomicrobiales bacterium]|nr:TetR/AcrR family transcriptional regulator [Thermomicrobiales bacterium]
MATKTDELVGKELLLEVACDLFMEAGYDGVSMQQIAEAAHMTKGSPYYHFKGKDDLFAQAFVHRTQQMHDGMVGVLVGSGDIRERLVRAVSFLLREVDAGMIRFMEDCKRHLPAETMESEQAFNPEALLDIYTPIFEEAATTIGLRIPAKRAAIVFFAMQMGTLHAMHLTGELSDAPAEIERVATETVDCFLYGTAATA